MWSFTDTKFFFWKPWNKKLTTSGLYQCSPSLCACKEVMACCGDGLHVKWISVSWSSQWKKTNGHGSVKPLCFSHPPPADEKQLLLTLRSRLQILSMLRILSLCGEDIKKVRSTILLSMPNRNSCLIAETIDDHRLEWIFIIIILEDFLNWTDIKYSDKI